MPHTRPRRSAPEVLDARVFDARAWLAGPDPGAYVPVAAIARYLGYDRSQIWRSVRRLREAGLWEQEPPEWRHYPAQARRLVAAQLRAWLSGEPLPRSQEWPWEVTQRRLPAPATLLALPAPRRRKRPLPSPKRMARILCPATGYRGPAPAHNLA